MNPQPKTVAHRNPALLDMARGRRCLLLAVEACETDRGDSTVACHSNWAKHGKGRARKADDQYSVWGCARCHDWLDNSSAPKAEKMRLFESAHLRQIKEWAKIEVDTGESEKNRKAARWALGLVNQ